MLFLRVLVSPIAILWYPVWEFFYWLMCHLQPCPDYPFLREYIMTRWLSDIILLIGYPGFWLISYLHVYEIPWWARRLPINELLSVCAVLSDPLASKLWCQIAAFVISVPLWYCCYWAFVAWIFPLLRRIIRCCCGAMLC